jgi:ferredoxin
MRNVLDLNRCQGYAQCCFLAPRLLGEEALVYRPNPDDGLVADVRRAAVACPVQAIVVEGPDAGGRPGGVA